MASNKETPVGIRSYYKLLYQRTLERQDRLINRIEQTQREINILYNSISDKLDYYKNTYNIVIDKECFEYDSKAINKIIKILTTCENNDAEDLGVIARMFKKLEQVYHMKHKFKIYEKILELTEKEYTEIVKKYFTEVQKQLILEGNAYNIGSKLGNLCIYRYRNCKKDTFLDYAATKKKREEILSRGGNIYNKEQEEWCKERGIEYKYEEHRVYRHDEFLYEILLFNSRVKNCYYLKFTPTDYRGRTVRGKTNDELIRECNRDKNKIMNLPLDVKTKLTLCLRVDSLLYNKFIRNENQTSIAFRKTNSED